MILTLEFNLNIYEKKRIYNPVRPHSVAMRLISFVCSDDEKKDGALPKNGEKIPSGKKCGRIDVFPVFQDFEMEMRSGGVSGHPHFSKNGRACHFFRVFDQNTLK